MRTLGIMTKDEVFTNLGLLLFDQCPFTIKVASFNDMDAREFQDRKEFSGSLFQQLEEVYDYIDLYNQTHSSFEKLRRIDQRNYPEVALRECLLNLLVHREYAFHASAFIRIYSDHIEFTSIGGLVQGLTLKDIMSGVSICRNEKLANVFYRLELIETYGTGIHKIFNAYSKTDKTPVIETTDNTFKIILPNLNAKTDLDSIENLSQEEQVIELAKEKETFTRKDIENALGISQASSIRLLKRLIENRRIVQIGKGRSIKYRLFK